MPQSVARAMTMLTERMQQEAETAKHQTGNRLYWIVPDRKLLSLYIYKVYYLVIYY